MRHLAQTDIAQYLDCGSGLPTAENTHQIVQRANPEARVVYVDNDPVVLAHGRALLDDNDLVEIVDADIFVPSQVLTNTVVRNRMREYLDALQPGSFVVFSHFFDPEVPELTEVAKRIENILVNGPMGAGRFRTRTEIEEMLTGLEIIRPNALTGPGLVPCAEWWPDGPRMKQLSKAARCIAGVVGRKP